MKINEKGRSMIEMLGVLAIIGVLSVGGIAGYAKAMAKFRANKTIDLVSHTVANTRILFGSQLDYSDLGTEWSAGVQTMAINAKLFPDEVVRGGPTGSGNNVENGTFQNAYAGNVALYAGHRLTTADKKAFIIALTGIPQSACIDLATQDWSASSGSGFVAMRVVGDTANNTTDVTTLQASYNADFDNLLLVGCSTQSESGKATICAADGKPMSTLAATVGCSAQNNNTMYFKFY